MRPADHGGLQHRRMGEQHLLDLARVDVGAARDDQVLRAIFQRDEPIGIDGAEIARPQPAIAQRLRVGGIVVPVAVHHAIAGGDDLADLARRQLAARLVDDADGDARARHADAGEPLFVSWVPGVGMQGLAEPADGHRTLALAIQVVQPGAEQGERALEVGRVHRRAAVDDGLQAPRLRRAGAGVIDEARHHGRRGEHADVGVARQCPEHALGLEGARQDYVVGSARDVGEGIEPRAVRQRRGMQDGVVRAQVVDVGVVAVAREQQVAVREHRAFRPAGGAAGIEHPGFVVGIAGLRRDRLSAKQRRVILRAGDENGRHRPDAGRRQCVGDLRRRQAQARLRVGHDPGHLARMQLAVDRHRRQAGAPHRIQRRQELWAVVHRQRHAGAGRQPVPAAQRAGHAGRLPLELAIRQRAALPRDRRMGG